MINVTTSWALVQVLRFFSQSPPSSKIAITTSIDQHWLFHSFLWDSEGASVMTVTLSPSVCVSNMLILHLPEKGKGQSLANPNLDIF